MPSENPPSSRVGPRDLLFGPSELEEARWLIQRAIAEDLPGADLTTEGLFGRGEGAAAGSPDVVLGAAYVSRAAGVLCGVPVVRELYGTHAPGVELQERRQDGDALEAGSVLLVARGPLVEILRLERISLNFLQRLSGVATETRRWKDRLSGAATRLLDTRKTTPGWRRLEKYAVRTGGGENHRESLSDAILLKDNHAEALRRLGRGRIRDWAGRLRKASPGVFLQVEVGSREEYLEALEADVDAILLDNFAIADLRWAVEARHRRGGSGPELEASGGIRPGNVEEVASSGVDRISVGFLTHSAPALDVGLDLLDVAEGAWPRRDAANRAGGPS